MENDYAFEIAASSIRFGPGATREIGMDLAEMGVRRAMVLTDAALCKLPPVAAVLESLSARKVEYALFDRVRVEPTDASFQEAIAFAGAGAFGGFVAVGGGSTMDTAKAANLYSAYPPGDFLDYVNPPIGKGRPVPGPLKPLFAVPTTAGTGSETTGVAIFDLERMHAKTGIAHRRLKPTLGIIDPENTRTLPPQVADWTGPLSTPAVNSSASAAVNERRNPASANSGTNGRSRLMRSIDESLAASLRTSCSRCCVASFGRPETRMW